MPKWTPLHLHSYYSLLDGLQSPTQIASKCEEYGYTSCAITDHGVLSGSVQFTQALKKKNIKPILGCEFYLSSQDPTIQSQENRKLSHLCLLAKNKKGWLQLIAASSRSNEDDVFYYKPRLSLDMLAPYCGDLISFSGHPGSDMCNVLFDGNPYACKTADEVRKILHPDWRKRAASLANKYQDIFGKGNFFLEVQLIDQHQLPVQIVIADCLRQVGKDTGILCVATADSHYTNKTDTFDHRVILCSGLKTTLPKVNSKLAAGNDVGLGGFFKTDQYHIPSPDEIEAINTQEEIDNTGVIAGMCEDYDILSRPRLPKFEWTEGMSESGYVRHLCRKGWTNRVCSEWDQNIYSDRIKKELGVFDKADLNGYFLIVQDYVNEAKNRGILVGPGRGSGAGSLAAYLLNITNVDPIPEGLLFERFYNDGRNTAERVSLPDFDIDFPIKEREEMIEYVKDKYGHDRVCQMVTFGRMQGRGAIKEVLRVHEACGYDIMNDITRNIPQEHIIDDQMKASGETSILNWTLENEPEAIADFCRKEDDGTLTGDYARYFEQAIRLEGTYKTQGKHAAGIIIAAEPLAGICPMVRDKTGGMIAGMDMNDLEEMGHVKFDFLGISSLSKLMAVNNLLMYGRINVD